MWEFTGTPRFELRRKLGAGGMGAVYEVWDRERRQRVALKTLTRLGPNDVIRFKREFRTLSAIIHPHLVRLYELIGEGEHWFFTMELLEGAQPLLSVATAPANASAVTETATEPMETVTMTTAGRLWEASAARRMRAPVLSAEYLDCMR